MIKDYPLTKSWVRESRDGGVQHAYAEKSVWARQSAQIT
jgi:hypothetical protein